MRPSLHALLLDAGAAAQAAYAAHAAPPLMQRGDEVVRLPAQPLQVVSAHSLRTFADALAKLARVVRATDVTIQVLADTGDLCALRVEKLNGSDPTFVVAQRPSGCLSYLATTSVRILNLFQLIKECINSVGSTTTSSHISVYSQDQPLHMRDSWLPGWWSASTSSTQVRLLELCAETC